MEEELRCFLCKEFYREPVLLPCGHALCRACAVNLQTHVHESDSSSSTTTDYQEADKASVSSETDSGVVCGSRPNSYAGTPAALACSPAAFSITCPTCNKQTYLDDNGAEGLPPFRVMRTIVERFGGTSVAPPAEEACQMCEGERRAAVVRCEQCSVRYCGGCRDAWHPIRGPLAQHELRALGTTCGDHGSPPALYCNTCLVPICQRCHAEKHHAHETHPLSNAARAHKTELSQVLTQLSEEAKAMTEYIQLVKSSGDKINESCEELERQIDQACSEITSAIERRRDELIRAARHTRCQAVANTKTLTSQAAQKLREATALLHFSIEALKESDHAAFLQVGNILSVRAQETASHLRSSLEPPPSPPALTLDIEPVIRTVKSMNFIECIPPGAPELAVEACAARGCSCTLAWRAPRAPHAVRGYVLELDDGRGGPFREVYCGRETVCTIDGLHYASLYSARVKAFNGAGEGPYSDVIGLQTASAVFMGGVGGFGVTAGAHRYWTHRSYKATLPFQVILMYCFASAGQNKVFDWVRDHRVHHKLSESNADPHDVRRGFFFSHVGWLMMKKHPRVIAEGRKIYMDDIRNDTLVQICTRHFTLIQLICCIIIPTVVPVVWWGERWLLSFLANITRYTLNLNFTWAVNSFAHLWGNKPYDPNIMPVENWGVSIVAMGEGWHNYHHTFPWDYKAAELSYFLNFTTLTLDAFAAIGWVYDRKQASRALIQSVVEQMKPT